MQINKTRWILVSVGIVAAMAIVAAIVYNASKSASNQAQELSRRADTILANKNITEIKDLKHIWELAPFVGNNIQLYGRMIFYPAVRTEFAQFAINGDLNLQILAEGNIEWAKEQGLSFTKDGDKLISNYCIINTYLAFEYLDDNIPESSDMLQNWNLEISPNGSLKLICPMLVKIFASQHKDDRPNSVRQAVYNAWSTSQAKFLLSGMDNADWLSFARYVSMLEKQKAETIQAKSCEGRDSEKKSLEKTQTEQKLAKIEYMADLIPFIGTSIELKGKIIKSSKFGFNYWLVSV